MVEILLSPFLVDTIRTVSKRNKLLQRCLIHNTQLSKYTSGFVSSKTKVKNEPHLTTDKHITLAKSLHPPRASNK